VNKKYWGNQTDTQGNSRKNSTKTQKSKRDEVTETTGSTWTEYTQEQQVTDNRCNILRWGRQSHWREKHKTGSQTTVDTQEKLLQNKRGNEQMSHFV